MIRPVFALVEADPAPFAEFRARIEELARQQYAADLLARIRWAVAVEWQILAHSVRNCTSAADARYAIELRSRPI